MLPAATPAFAQTRDQARVTAMAQGRADDAIVEMGQAFRRGDRARLTALLPLVSGHTLEPWGAYWDLKSRLETAPASEVQEFFTRFAGTYQEDRLRNDWLLLLGQRRDWTTFAAEHPKYRMGDDREVRCYALAADGTPASAEAAASVKRLWYAQRDADDGCQHAAARLHAAGKLKDADVWRKARLAMEANRPKAAKLAADLVAPDAADQIGEIAENPVRYLSKRVIAASKVSKESVLLALIRMAANDADATAAVLENHWSVHLMPGITSYSKYGSSRSAEPSKKSSSNDVNPRSRPTFETPSSRGSVTNGPAMAVEVSAINAEPATTLVTRSEVRERGCMTRP